MKNEIKIFLKIFFVNYEDLQVRIIFQNILHLLKY